MQTILEKLCSLKFFGVLSKILIYSPKATFLFTWRYSYKLLNRLLVAPTIKWVLHFSHYLCIVQVFIFVFLLNWRRKHTKSLQVSFWNSNDMSEAHSFWFTKVFFYVSKQFSYLSDCETFNWSLFWIQTCFTTTLNLKWLSYFNTSQRRFESITLGRGQGAFQVMKI